MAPLEPAAQGSLLAEEGRGENGLAVFTATAGAGG